MLFISMYLFTAILSEWQASVRAFVTSIFIYKHIKCCLVNFFLICGKMFFKAMLLEAIFSSSPQYSIANILAYCLLWKADCRKSTWMLWYLRFHETIARMWQACTFYEGSNPLCPWEENPICSRKTRIYWRKSGLWVHRYLVQIMLMREMINKMY